MYPKIQLDFDKELDKDMAWSFYNDPSFGGCDFWKERAIKHHKDLTNIENVKNKKEFLEKYIDDFYSQNTREMHELSQLAFSNLESAQDKYFTLVSKIFHAHDWPDQIYTGYLSIFDFCPRFLDSACFQIFLYDEKNMQLFTIFHEMLHFIFYDYAKKNFSAELGALDTESGKFWELAEVFNAVMQDTDDFRSLHGKINDIGYPDHKMMIEKGMMIWKKKDDVDLWIKQMI